MGTGQSIPQLLLVFGMVRSKQMNNELVILIVISRPSLGSSILGRCVLRLEINSIPFQTHSVCLNASDTVKISQVGNISLGDTIIGSYRMKS